MTDIRSTRITRPIVPGPAGSSSIDTPAPQRPADQPPADTIARDGQAGATRVVRPDSPATGVTLPPAQAGGGVVPAFNEQDDAVRRSAEADAEKEARKPSFFRAVLEIAEFVGRLFMPFFNLVSALVRVTRVGYDLLSGREVDWKNESQRLMGDVIGIFFPPAGAFLNAGMNWWNDESELLGGANKFFDEGEQPFSVKHYAEQGIGKAISSVKGWISGDKDSPAIRERPAVKDGAAAPAALPLMTPRELVM